MKMLRWRAIAAILSRVDLTIQNDGFSIQL
jgi:hypothetical protein